MKAVEKYMSDIQDISHSQKRARKTNLSFDKNTGNRFIPKIRRFGETDFITDFSQLAFKESNVLSMMETIGYVTIETSPSDMNYQPSIALQAQSKNRAIKPAIQNKFEFDSRIPFECKHEVNITSIGV